MNDPWTLNATVLRCFCMGKNCLYCTMGRIDRTVPPSPANSAPTVICLPLFGYRPLSKVLNEKFGKILLVRIPDSALGPEMPRNARNSNRLLDAVLSAIRDDRSSEQVMPKRVNERCRG